jgi:hypothetical protein
MVYPKMIFSGQGSLASLGISEKNCCLLVALGQPQHKMPDDIALNL